MFSGVSIHQLWLLQVSTKINFRLNSFKKHLWREISQLQHRIITKRNSGAVFFLPATVPQVPKLRVPNTSCSRLQIHHSPQVWTKPFLLWCESNINKGPFNLLLLGAIMDSMREDAALYRRRLFIRWSLFRGQGKGKYFKLAQPRV